MIPKHFRINNQQQNLDAIVEPQRLYLGYVWFMPLHPYQNWATIGYPKVFARDSLISYLPQSWQDF
jgi:hypothetical protein